MIIINIMGGLGNQMFGFALYEGMKRRGKEVKVDLSFNRASEETRRQNPNGGIERNIGLLNLDYEVASDDLVLKLRNADNSKDILSRINRVIHPKKRLYYPEKADGSYNPKIYEIENGYLDGYWQTEKYFLNLRSEILKLYTFPPFVNDYQKQLCYQIEHCNSVAIHVRRGDYLQHVNEYGNTDLDYYYNAMEFIKKQQTNVHFFIFSNDPKWVKQNFKGENIVYVEYNPNPQIFNFDMWLISKCHHCIIANSSFSWWGAWLNQNTDKIVIAPKRWIIGNKTPDIWCNQWIKM